MIPLHSRLENGATVADWLGTARTASGIATSYIDLVRQGLRTDAAALERAVEKLDQAIEEIKTVQAHLAYTKARGEKL